MHKTLNRVAIMVCTLSLTAMAKDAISASVAAWDKVPHMLAVAGQNRSKSEHDAVHIFTIKGVKIAFLAYTAYINNDAPAQNDYGVNIFTKEFASSQIAQAKQQGAQVIIASMRWGTEYSTSVDAEQKALDQLLRAVWDFAPFTPERRVELRWFGRELLRAIAAGKRWRSRAGA